MKVKYRHLLCFVADFESPSIHTKKARVWALRQFLTIDEYNKILSHCSQKADTRLGIRNLVIILMLGLLGLRTGTIISLNIWIFAISPSSNSKSGYKVRHEATDATQGVFRTMVKGVIA